MKSRHSLMATLLFFPFLCGAQEQSVIPLNSEPHHHLALHNEYVNVYSVYGYVHSTSIDGATPYRNLTVELLAPQQSPRNLCAAVIPAQPVNCPQSPQRDAHGSPEQPQFQTDQTKIALIRILPLQSATLDTHGLSQLIVVLDDVGIPGNKNSPGKVLRTGDFVWRDPRSAPETFSNNSTNEVRLVSFAFQ